MVISSKVEITVLALKEQKSKDGTKTYYRLAVFDQINCESGMLPCSEEVAKLWQTLTSYIFNLSTGIIYSTIKIRTINRP